MTCLPSLLVQKTTLVVHKTVVLVLIVQQTVLLLLLVQNTVLYLTPPWVPPPTCLLLIPILSPCPHLYLTLTPFLYPPVLQLIFLHHLLLNINLSQDTPHEFQIPLAILLIITAIPFLLSLNLQRFFILCPLFSHIVNVLLHIIIFVVPYLLILNHPPFNKLTNLNVGDML